MRTSARIAGGSLAEHQARCASIHSPIPSKIRSTRAINAAGIVSSNAWTVLRLIASSILLTLSTGTSSGRARAEFSPLAELLARPRRRCRSRARRTFRRGRVGSAGASVSCASSPRRPSRPRPRCYRWNQLYSLRRTGDRRRSSEPVIAAITTARSTSGTTFECSGVRSLSSPSR